MKGKDFAVCLLMFFLLLFAAGMIVCIVAMFIGKETVGGYGYIGAVSSLFLALSTMLVSGLCEDIK